MKIPRHTLDAINAQADLVGIIGKHTKLKPANGKFKGCCPFHSEKTPSFTVDPQKNLYHCFGCGVGGNAFSFLVDYEKMTFMEAVKSLAQSTGIELPKEEEKKQYIYQRSPKQPHQTAPSPNQIVQPDGTLYGLLQAVARFYEQQLRKTPQALQYFRRRGLSDETIAYFQLGYAPNDWQHLQNAFAQDIQGLIALGLIRPSKKGGYYDFFRNRVMFAIKDNQGQVVGFAGRAMDDGTTPKYLNSQDSPLFKKNQILYGAYEARQKRVRDFLVVEGYMDVIALYQAGIYGAVAPMGTAMNEGQIAHLMRFSDVLTLCFDGDTAGQKAALRTMQTAMPVLEDGKMLQFLTLPDHHDPDTFVQEFGRKKMQEAIDNAIPLSAYLAHHLHQTFAPITPERLAAAMRYVRELTDKLPKGSTFGWSLKSAMYQSLKRSDPPKPKKPQVPPKPLTTGEALMLTILCKPSLTAGNWLDDFYAKLNLQAVDQLFEAKIKIPKLPSWQAFNIDGLAELLDAVELTRPQINDHPTDDFSIDTYAQLILMVINENQQKIKRYLMKLWRDFFAATKNNPIDNVDLMFDELLCQLLIQFLEQEQHQLGQQVCQDTLLLSNLYKRRLTAVRLFADHLFEH